MHDVANILSSIRCEIIYNFSLHVVKLLSCKQYFVPWVGEVFRVPACIQEENHSAKNLALVSDIEWCAMLGISITLSIFIPAPPLLPAYVLCIREISNIAVTDKHTLALWSPTDVGRCSAINMISVNSCWTRRNCFNKPCIMLVFRKVMWLS